MNGGTVVADVQQGNFGLACQSHLQSMREGAVITRRKVSGMQDFAERSGLHEIKKNRITLRLLRLNKKEGKYKNLCPERLHFGREFFEEWFLRTKFDFPLFFGFCCFGDWTLGFVCFERNEQRLNGGRRRLFPLRGRELYQAFCGCPSGAGKAMALIQHFPHGAKKPADVRFANG